MVVVDQGAGTGTVMMAVPFKTITFEADRCETEINGSMRQDIEEVTI